MLFPAASPRDGGFTQGDVERCIEAVWPRDEHAFRALLVVYNNDTAVVLHANPGEPQGDPPSPAPWTQVNLGKPGMCAHTRRRVARPVHGLRDAADAASASDLPQQCYAVAIAVASDRGGRRPMIGGDPPPPSSPGRRGEVKKRSRSMSPRGWEEEEEDSEDD